MREFVDSVHREQIYPRLLKGAEEDREIAHDNALKYLSFLENTPWPIRSLLRKYFTYQDPILEQDIFGLHFRSPVGQAAGLDKNGVFPKASAAIGASFTEIGTVTPNPQDGQNRPRVIALPEDRALINHMGFPSIGSHAVRENLVWSNPRKEIILGVNIGPNAESIENGNYINDYTKCAEEFSDIADYLAVNVSSPNTTGLRSLQQKRVLHDVLSAVRHIYKGPLVVKVSPDLTDSEFDEVIDVSLNRGVDGLVISNTTTDPFIRGFLQSENRDFPGGISGPPVKAKSLEKVKQTYEKTKGQLPVIGVGGIRTTRDAIEYLENGGSLFETFTGLVEESSSTPNFFYYLNRGIAYYLRREGAKNITEAIGSAVPV